MIRMRWLSSAARKLVGTRNKFVLIDVCIYNFYVLKLYVAAEVLSTNHSFVVLKTLSEATVESRARAKKSANSLQPYRQRPETCAALARRLVTGALGVRLKTSTEERENERRVLREAKGKSENIRYYLIYFYITYITSTLMYNLRNKPQNTLSK